MLTGWHAIGFHRSCNLPLLVFLILGVTTDGQTIPMMADLPGSDGDAGGVDMVDGGLFVEEHQQQKQFQLMASTCQECSNYLVTNSNISGLCCCTPLFDLRCSKLTSIPTFSIVEPNHVMAGAYLDNQLITGIPAGIFKQFKVRKLNFNRNPIGSGLEDGSLAGLQDDLHELYLGECDIEKLPSGLIQGLAELRHLHLWANRIKNIPAGFFSSAGNLQELLLWGNQLRRIDNETFAGLNSLRKLDLDRNNLEVINRYSFNHLRSLTVLHLGENYIKNIHMESFSRLSNLKVLSMDENQIESFHTKTFHGLKNLFTLALNKNRIQHLPTNVFLNLSRLTTILLQDNRIESIWSESFASLEALRTLDLSRNKLNSIPNASFSNSSRLLYLYLDSNQLKTFDRCAFPSELKMKVFSLLNNQIQCDCRILWINGLSQDSNTQVWGICQKSRIAAGPKSIVGELKYLVEINFCRNTPVACLK